MKNLFFDMHDAGMSGFESIASTVGLLQGRGNIGITFGFPVSARTLEAVSAHCRCEAQAGKVAATQRYQNLERMGLAFSGGFEALMDRDLLSAGTALLSPDSGGRYARERAMFTIFGSHVMGTNLVDIGGSPWFVVKSAIAMDDSPVFWRRS